VYLGPHAAIEELGVTLNISHQIEDLLSGMR
jgi:hypothetical protein